MSPEEREGSANDMAQALVREGVVTQFQAGQFLQGKSRGFFIGNYKVLERLGTGGMGLVYLCEHRLMRRRVAIKVLPNASAKDVECLKRFYREARVSAALDHPHIVRAYDVDEDEKHHYQVMEFVDGSLLHDIVVKQGPLDIHRAAHYISMAALGLQHAHECNFVHRDIKPNNLILDRTGVCKILDMGLARVFSDSEEVLTRGILGTPDYLAPEQSIDSHHVDIRADIYSLGCTMYFLLSGRAPFGEGSVAQKLQWHQSAQPPPLREFRPDVPQEMAAVVEVMMAKDPEHRFQLPIEVVEALAPWTAVPIPPPSEDEMPRLSPAARGAGYQTVTGMVGRGAVSLAGGAARPATQVGQVKPLTPQPQTRTKAPVVPAAKPSAIPVSKPPPAPVPASKSAAAPPKRSSPSKPGVAPQQAKPAKPKSTKPVIAEETPGPVETVRVPPSGPRRGKQKPVQPPLPRPDSHHFHEGSRTSWLRILLVGLLLLGAAAAAGFAASWALFGQ